VRHGRRATSAETFEPVESSFLPRELAAFLRTTDIACIMHETNQGTVFVVKLLATEIASLSGLVPDHDTLGENTDSEVAA
jgi:hypothetical protein